MPSSPVTFAIPADPSSVTPRAADFVRALGEAAGCPVRLLPLPSHAALQAAAEQGACDLVWAPPLVALDLSQFRLATPLCSVVRGGRAFYPSVLFVGQGGRVKTIDDLRGSRVAWVSRLSAAGYVVPRLFLESLGLLASSTFADRVFLGSHQRVVEAVASGEVDVGAGYASFRRFSSALELPEGSEGVKILCVCGSVPSEVVMACRTVPGLLGARLRAALSSLDGAALAGLRPVLHAERLVAAGEGHLDRLRGLMAKARMGSVAPERGAAQVSREALRFFEG